MAAKKSMYNQLEEIERKILLSKLVDIMHKDNAVYCQVASIVNGAEANGKLDNIQYLNDIDYRKSIKI